jgi:23S rRNA (guanosine2251-2'-O)-methyltransferase
MKQTQIESYYLYGKHPVLMALNNKNRIVKKLYLTLNTNNFLKEKLPHEQFSKLKIDILNPHQMDRLVGKREDIVHQGIVAEVAPLQQPELFDLVHSKLFVALDKISDPHNIGAIVRCAAAFGAAGVITQDRAAPDENATIAKISAGCLEVIPYIKENNLKKSLEFLKQEGFKLIALAGEGQKFIGEISDEARKKAVLIIGSEGKGISDSILEICDEIVRINMSENVESLNASVACAVALYEISRE